MEAGEQIEEDFFIVVLTWYWSRDSSSSMHASALFMQLFLKTIGHLINNVAYCAVSVCKN